MRRAVLEHRLLAPGTDLRGEFVKALAAHVEGGWQLGEFSSSVACAFCTRENERRAITVEFEDPMRLGTTRQFPS